MKYGKAVGVAAVGGGLVYAYQRYGGLAKLADLGRRATEFVSGALDRVSEVSERVAEVSKKPFGAAHEQVKKTTAATGRTMAGAREHASQAAGSAKRHVQGAADEVANASKLRTLRDRLRRKPT